MLGIYWTKGKFIAKINAFQAIWIIWRFFFDPWLYIHDCFYPTWPVRNQTIDFDEIRSATLFV